jgi:hypothetical protein
MVRTSVSEFPNDNPELHAGAVWILREPCGPLVSEVFEVVDAVEDTEEHLVEIPAAESAVAEAIPDVEPTVVEVPAAIDSEPVESRSLDLVEVVVESIVEDDGADEPADDRVAPAQTIEPPPPDPFDDFVQTLVGVTAAQGGACAAAALPDLLEGRNVPNHALDGDAIQALVAGGYASRAEEGLLASEKLTGLVTAWTGVLRRTGDFSSCGSTMLHEWAAELVACALGAPQRAQALQYELRRRGVAAFGLVRVAA